MMMMMMMMMMVMMMILYYSYMKIYAQNGLFTNLSLMT